MILVSWAVREECFTNWRRFSGKLDSFLRLLWKASKLVSNVGLLLTEYKGWICSVGTAFEGLPNKYSALEYLLRETEAIHGRIRRYTSPDEHAFFPEDVPEPILPPLEYAPVINSCFPYVYSKACKCQWPSTKLKIKKIFKDFFKESKLPLQLAR